MSVSLFPLQSPTPNATPAIPSSREGEADSFQNVFANSQRTHQSNQSNVRDDSAASVSDRSKATESKSRDARESEAEGKQNKSDTSKSSDDRAASLREDRAANSDANQSKRVEKQVENEQSDDPLGTEESGPLQVEPVQVESVEPDSLDPAVTLAVLQQSEGSDAALPLIDEALDDTDAEASDADAENVVVETESGQSNSTNNPAVELPEAAVEVVASDANVGLAPVPVENVASKVSTHQSADQRASDSESLGQQGHDIAQATTGQQTSSDSDEQSNTSLGDSSSNAESLKSARDSNGLFALPGSATIAEPVATEAAGTLTSVTAGNDRPAGSIATPVPIAQPDTPELRDDANIARISRGLQSAVNQRGGNVTLRLDPPELGQVRIEMEVRDGVVTARFTAQSESVRRLLIDQMGQLRGALDRQGLSIEKLDVQTSGNQNQGWNSSQENNHDGRSKGQYSQRQSQGQAGKQGTELQLDTFESQLNHAE